MPTSLQIKNITTGIQSRILCRNLSFSVEPGNVIGILGPNGSGKTILLHTLARLIKPLQGQISLDDVDITQFPAKKLAQKIGILLQDTQFIFPQSVFDYCLAGRYPHLNALAREKKLDYLIARDALTFVELTHCETNSTLSLSGGERRRLAIATLLTQQPNIYLLDEPTNHLDLRHQFQTLNHFKQLAEWRSCAVLMSLHDPNYAEQYCNKILCLFRDGSWLFGDTSDILTVSNLSQLYDHPIGCEKVAGRNYWLGLIYHENKCMHLEKNPK